MTNRMFDFDVEARPSTRSAEMEGWFQIVICHGNARKPVTDWQPAPLTQRATVHSVLQGAAAVAKQQIQLQFH